MSKMHNKRTILLLSIPILCGMIAWLFFTSSDSDPESFRDFRNRFDEKHRPVDHFFLQRSWPDTKFDLEAYEQTLTKSLIQAQNQARSNGYNEPWQQEGPGNIGGRINTVAIHPDDSDIIYLGYSTGGVFKTEDRGETWNAVFDAQKFLSIGNIAFDPSDPETVYVGTGDSNISGFPFIGDGIYKSTDGGQSWSNIGLSQQRIISKIIVDPVDPQTIYAGTMGLPFEPNSDRGLYRTKDGGQNWEQVLYLSDTTGIIDMVMDPNNPQVILASGWDRIRNEFQSIIYGEGAKIYRTTDGGDTWTPLSQGLPTGKFCRIGLAASQQNPNTFFALYNDTTIEVQGIYKTVDGGDTWNAITLKGQNGLPSNVMGRMGWYFGQIRVNPNDDDQIYVPGVRLWRTDNGGQNWQRADLPSGSLIPHVDYHDIAFDPDGSILVGTDGGAYRQAIDQSWTDIEDNPTTQFYRLGYNPHRPQFSYGGAQDNGTIFGNQSNISSWESLLGLDGFQPVFHPIDSNIYYAETQFGSIYRTADDGRNWTAIVSGIDPFEERNWDMPYLMSPSTPDLLFTGTNRVFKLTNPATGFWQPISRDLTDPVKTNPFFHTISSLDVSAFNDDLIYVGTSDGNVHKSENGRDWTPIQQGLPDRYVTAIKASRDSVNHVFVSFSGYKVNDNTPHIFYSADRGNTWESIQGDLPNFAINDFYVLPDEGHQVIFAGTDGGVYVTTNGGANWFKLGTQLPLLPVYDVEYNVQQNKLLAGTFGRSIYSYPVDSIDFEAEPVSTVYLAGKIRTEEDVPVPNVEVSLSATIGSSQDTISSVNGDYLFNGVATNSSVTLKPRKNTAANNGISTFDIVLVARHILETEYLDSPYKIMAADVNGTGTVTAFDMVDMRKVFFLLENEFSEVESWQFVPADFQFPNPSNPFASTIPDVYNVQQVRQDLDSLNFVAIKTGDVNNTANPSRLIGSEDRNGETLELIIQDQWLEAGKYYEIPLSINSDIHLLGLQMLLHMNPEFADNLTVTNMNLPKLSHENFGRHFISEGKLPVSWYDLDIVNYKAGNPIFSIGFSAKENVKLSDLIFLDQEKITVEAYNEKDELLKLNLIFEAKEEVGVTPSFQLSQNVIAVGETTELRFDASRNIESTIYIYSAEGKLVKTQEVDGVGEINLNLQTNTFSPGLYFITSEIQGQIVTERLVIH